MKEREFLFAHWTVYIFNGPSEEEMPDSIMYRYLDMMLNGDKVCWVDDALAEAIASDLGARRVLVTNWKHQHYDTGMVA